MFFVLLVGLCDDCLVRAVFLVGIFIIYIYIYIFVLQHGDVFFWYRRLGLAIVMRVVLIPTLSFEGLKVEQVAKGHWNFEEVSIKGNN